MNKNILADVLNKLKSGELSVEEATNRITYEDIGFAKIDHQRQARRGYPEVIYGEGKTIPQARDIFAAMVQKSDTVLCTRTSKEMAAAIIEVCPAAIYNDVARIVVYKKNPIEGVGLVAVATGGTADLPVAEEAAVVLEAFGSRVLRLYDVGVAGVHRLLSNHHMLKEANCVIAVAGMEGALPSVVGGLVSVPVIAVPTSVGYGASFSGLAPLLTMLCTCAEGVTVVNIDNGFGAAYSADMINKAYSRSSQ
jgi:NCAIR mutase (PurE)-related protein